MLTLLTRNSKVQYQVKIDSIYMGSEHEDLNEFG